MYDLLALKIAGEAAAKELQELEYLLLKYPEFKFLYDELVKPDYDKNAAREHALQAYAAHYYSKMYLEEPVDELADKGAEGVIQPALKK